MFYGCYGFCVFIYSSAIVTLWGRWYRHRCSRSLLWPPSQTSIQETGNTGKLLQYVSLAMYHGGIRTKYRALTRYGKDEGEMPSICRDYESKQTAIILESQYGEPVGWACDCIQLVLHVAIMNRALLTALLHHLYFITGNSYENLSFLWMRVSQV